MKSYVIIKAGFSAGLSDCTNEFFICIFTSGGEIRSFNFKGLFGAEARVARALREKGYAEGYASFPYQQIKGKDARWAGWLEEDEALGFVQAEL